MKKISLIALVFIFCFQAQAQVNWTARTSAADSDWYNVAYGNGLFVAIAGSGAGNQVMTSPDGIAWTARTAPTGSDWYSITYGNGLFVAVAFSGTNQVMTSPDGITWTARTAAAYQWRSVTYGNGLFVAVASSGAGDRVMTSTDGITWTARASAVDNNWGSVTYGNGVFVAVSFDGTNRVMTSPDGITWTAQTASVNNAWYGITYGKGLFVATAIEVGPFTSGSGNRVMTSPDGITWTTRTSAEDNTWYSVTYGNGIFVALSYDGVNQVMTSTDGITWTAGPAVVTNAWNGVIYGNGLFVAVASTGTGNRVMTANAAVSRLTIDAIANQTYTGSALTPAIVVKDDATTLTLGTHYSVAYSNNTNPGTATVTITGMGNYTGTKTETFSIAVPPPTITSFTPTTAATGATVTLTGTNFTGATAVSFGGTAATSFNVVSATSITAVLAGGTSGNVSITTPGGTAVLAGFTFIPAPVITSFSPASGSVGTLVTITGTNLGTPTAFTIGGAAAIVISNTGTSLVGMVMPGAVTGTLSLTTAGGSATSAATFTLSATTAPNTQQGAKLVGTGISGSPTLGYSVSLSADGTTAIVGGYNDNSFQGAAWIFTRSGATWTQQGAKLVGTGNSGAARQGFSVSLSADGNTAIVGGYKDNLDRGAAWIYTRSGTTWTQQGNKLVGSGATGFSQQGYSVSISADGNTAIVGGFFDNSSKGAAWIYTRSGSTWSQQGNKLVGTAATGNASQGHSVSLSADGNTAIVGGISDNGGKGAAWIYTRSGSTWTQQGAKLVGTGAVGNAYQGRSVSLSADGTTAIVGGTSDNSNQGAAWIYTRSGTTWTQQGTKLVGAGNTGAAEQGRSVSLSADGNTAIVSGSFDNSFKGAAWIYTRNGTTWSQLGDKLVGTGAVGNAYQGHGVSLSADGTTAMVGGGSDDGSKGAVWVYNYVQPPAPTITSFTPTSAVTGGTVTITGTDFTGATAVSFGGTAATSFNVVSSTSITAVLAAGTSGNVSVTTWGGTAVLAGFTFIPTPVITSFTPTSAATGATVTLTGTDFTGATAVSFGGTAANSFNVVSATSITAVVAAGTSGNVSVTNPDGTGVLAGFTFIPAPVITSFTPTSAGPTATVTLTGTNFTGATAVSFGGTAATSFNVVSATSITAVVAAGTSGNVSVTTPGGTGVLAGFTFFPAPVITSFTPTSAGSTATVTITGTNFTGATAVSFGGIPATSFNVVSATSITAVVSALGASGNVSVTTPGGTAVLAGFTFPAPVITSFSPSSGSVGTLVTITGNNLGTPTAFTIGGTAAIVISNTGTSLVGMVMPGAASGTLSLTTASGSVTSATTFTVSAASAPNVQQGTKLVGTGNTGAAGQGYAVSISADGTTAIVGGLFDNLDQGAAWIYTRSGTTWTQQGTKLVGTGAVGTSQQGVAVSLSADGNTAIVGGNEDDGLKGAAWIFTRSGATWTQQGAKLVGTGAIGTAQQGRSVSLSADGNTAIVGGSTDNSSQGAVWIFTRSGTTWTQQGAKLVGTGNTGAAQQGRSVSLSADGNTAILGGYFDNTGQGAVWIFTRSGTTWTQQGAKLVGTGAVGAARQGQAVSLSADGTTAIVGGNADNFITQGAAWIFTRSGATWTQQGTKLVGTGYTGTAAGQGWAVSLSADGTTAILGGYADNSDQGAVWIFTRSGTTWSQQGAKLVGTGAVGAARQGWAASLSADGTTAILGGYADNTEQGAVWAYNYVPPPPTITSFTPTSAATGATVTLTGTNFTGATAVSFGGTAATSFNVVSATSITAVVAAGTSGDVSVTTVGGTGVLAGFTFIPAPVITSFSPASGPVGTLVTITGTNLGSPTAFTIGGTAAIVISNTGTSLVGMVMPGAATGTLSLTTAGGSVTSTGTFTLSATPAPNTQQGAKLVGIGNTGAAQQGYIVSISADGTTAIVGGESDDSNQGAAWIYTRSGATWSQQGDKLVGTGNTGAAQQGVAVSLSADGNTAIVGGYADNSNQGAAWIYTRSGTTWTQQGAKLVGTGNTGAARQGRAVSLSADGNTAIVSGNFDNSNQGAAWIFTRSGTTWTQQGAKLVGTGNTGAAQQGRTVSLSADGTTAIVGGNRDNSDQGAAWIFSRSGTTWTQQGAKLVGTGNTGAARQGTAVSLSADGTTAILGGNTDDTNQGAAWIFTRSGTTWTQQGAKLVGTGNTGAAQQGAAVSLSADGTTAIVGGYTDNLAQGAAWIFTRSGTTWSQRGAKLVGTGNTGAAGQGVAVSLSADGTTALVGGLYDNSSQGAAWVYTYVPPPTITSATYNASTGVLVVTGTNLVATAGATNDIDVTKLTFTGQGGSTFTLTSNTTYVEITNGTSFTVSLGATDKTSVNALLNKDGTSSIGGTTYTIAAADNWNPAMTGSADLSGNGITVSNVATISTTGTLAGLTTIYATASSTTSFSVSGASLTNDIIVTAPTGFEVSVSTTSGFGNTVTLTQISGTVSITTVYVRLKSSSTVAGSPYSGNVTCTSTNAQTVNVATVSSTVTALGLTITGVSASNKEYDANLTATLGGTPTLVGVAIADQANVTLAGTATATFNNAGVGTSKAVTVTGYTLGGTAAGNYTVSQPSGLTGNITAKGLTITGVTASNKEYDANTKATLGGTATLVGVETADQANVTLAGTATATFNNASVGTSKAVTVTGYTLGGTAAGNYTVSQPTGLIANISAKAVSTLSIDPIANQNFTGTAISPSVVVKEGATTLTLGTDYSVAYSNNTNVGTATVTITGIGVYTGTKTQTFAIVSKAVSTLTIDPIANQNFTGAAITPPGIVKDGATTLTLGTDYSVAYSNNTNVGTATVTITGMGTYTGTKTQTFSIVPKAASTLTIDAIASQTYTGATITPSVIVKDGSTTLTLGTDYTVAYSGNTNAGMATVTITGMGNYSGDNSQTFAILPKAATIRANNASKIYGDANPSLSFSYSGLVAGDTEIDQVPVISTTASTTSGVGNYPITLTGGSDPNYSLTLVEGVLEVSPAPLSLEVNNASKIYGQADPVYTYSMQGLKGSDTDAVLGGAFTRETGEDPGTYRISQGSLSAGANYTFTVTGSTLQILKAKVSSVAQLALLTTAWSKEPALPATVMVLAAHGQDFQVEVKWDKSTLNLLARGTYSLTGRLLLPAGIENPNQVLAKIQVQVLPKPAPRDVTITNDTFVGSTTAFFISVGDFVVNDPVDNIHVVSLLGDGYDNTYFEIKNNILFWSSAERAPGKTRFSIVVRVTDRDGNTLDKFFEIKRTRPDFSTVTIFNTFTPNGDRFNDTWGVPEIRFYEGVRISVYERSGTRLFYTENPDVRWDGTFEGKELPIGSYYWVIQIDETGLTRRGMVNLIRK